MRALLNFGGGPSGLTISFCDSTATKGLGVFRKVKDREALLRVIGKLRGDVAEAENALRCWGQGSTWVELSPGQCRFFGVKSTDGPQ